MKVLIVAKTRQGSGACVGGITFDGRSVRLLAPASAGEPAPERWGLDFQVAEVWEIEGEPAPRAEPPHTEDWIVRKRKRLGPMTDPSPFIERHMPPHRGRPGGLFEGLVQWHGSGALYIDRRGGVPSHSTAFWRPDRPLHRETTGKRVHYQYPGLEGDLSLPFVGFQDPPEVIPAGTLVRVSLAHWWRSPERPDEEPHCYLQLSGWFGDLPVGTVPAPPPRQIVEDREPPPEFEPPREEPRSTPPPRAVRKPQPRGPAPSPEAVHHELERVFGFRELRPFQERIIHSVLEGHDTLGIMPTGAGKSLCYQLPALLWEGLTVVVSPLLSLMQDQIDQLREAGVAAVTLNSILSHSEYREAVRQVRAGEAKLLYLAPETLLRPETQLLLEESRVSCFTVDEAHCISEWGHDFRPEYRQIRTVRDRFPEAVCLALTATATERVRADIGTILGIAPQHTFVAGFDRPNLFLEVRRRGDAVSQLREFLAAHPDQAGIIYCNTRKQVEDLTQSLRKANIRALPYHAGLQDYLRSQNQQLFQRDEATVMVATVAFGMGINKSNVRFVAHYALPECLETYYQQVGRAGRDGLRSNCLLLFSAADLATRYHLINEGSAAERPGRAVRLQAMVRFAESTGCRRATLLRYFGEEPAEGSCGMCDNCLAEASGRTPVDVSEDARLFLQCIGQLRERFGRGQVIDVLRGSQSAAIQKWKHDQLSAHGTGKHRSAEVWRQLADRFIELGLVEVEMQHGTLRVTEAGRAALAGEPVLVILEEPAAPRPADTAGECDPVLFASLRKLRKELADAARIAPFMVFSDRTLTEMARTCPQTRAAFLKISGVGERKAEVYGDRFLEVVRAHVEEHGLPAAAEPDGLDGQPEPGGLGSIEGRRCFEVGEAYRSGLSIAELQERWSVTSTTIVDNLHKYLQAGGALDPARLLAESRLPEPEREQALAAFRRLGPERLDPVNAALRGRVSYPELHLLRLYVLCEAQEGGEGEAS